MARRRLIAFGLIGIVAYALAMIATMPASVLVRNVPWRTGVSGTIWNGQVGVAGGSVIAWHWAPLRSLTTLSFAADWTATGGDTDLGGQMRVGWSAIRLDKVSGAADSSLLHALQPNLPFTCDFVMQVEMDRVVLGGGDRLADGTITTDPGSCTGLGGNIATPVPALYLTAQHLGNETRIRLVPATQRRKTLIDAKLAENGALAVTVTADGAATLPFLGAPAGITINGQM